MTSCLTFPGIDVNGSETRKRPLDSETELSETKRSHPGQGKHAFIICYQAIWDSGLASGGV